MSPCGLLYKSAPFFHCCGHIRRWFVCTIIIVYFLAFTEELGDVVAKETSGQFQELLLKILKVWYCNFFASRFFLFCKRLELCLLSELLGTDAPEIVCYLSLTVSPLILILHSACSTFHVGWEKWKSRNCHGRCKRRCQSFVQGDFVVLTIAFSCHWTCFLWNAQVKAISEGNFIYTVYFLSLRLVTNDGELMKMYSLISFLAEVALILKLYSKNLKRYIVSIAYMLEVLYLKCHTNYGFNILFSFFTDR